MGIRQLLKDRILVFDGAMGTMLQKQGLPTGKIPEIINFTHPEIIEDIYRRYLSAGSDIICTNTFGANRFKTEGSGFTVDEIITQAIKLARGRRMHLCVIAGTKRRPLTVPRLAS